MAGLGDRKTFSAISAIYLRDSAGEKVKGKILDKDTYVRYP